MTEFPYSSPLKEYIQGMILQKRSLGYKFDSSPRLLYKFDQFCLTYGCTEPVLSKELVLIWSQKRPNEAYATVQHRVGIIMTLNTKSSGNLTLNRQDIRRKREGAPSLFLAENQGLPTHATGGYPNAIRNPSTQKAVFSPSCLRC